MRKLSRVRELVSHLDNSLVLSQEIIIFPVCTKVTSCCTCLKLDLLSRASQICYPAFDTFSPILIDKVFSIYTSNYGLNAKGLAIALLYRPGNYLYIRSDLGRSSMMKRAKEKNIKQIFNCYNDEICLCTHYLGQF